MTNVSYFIVIAVWLIVSTGLRAQNINNMTDSTKTSMPPEKNKVHVFSKNDGYTLLADLSELDDNAGILFFDSACTIIGLDHIPRALYCSPNLNISTLPEYIQKNFTDIRVIIFETTLSEDDHNKKGFLPMPKWILGVPNLEYITLNDVKLDKWFFTAGLPIKHLVIEEISLVDKKIIFKNISKIKTLEYLVLSNIFTADDIASMKREFPEIIVLSEQEYDAKLNSGEIPLPDWSKRN